TVFWMPYPFLWSSCANLLPHSCLNAMPEAPILTPALEWSGALRRKLAGHPAFADWLAQAAALPLTRATIRAWLVELKHSDSDAALPADEVRRLLRHLRERVFFTALVRDVNGTASLQEVVAAMTILADLAVSEAY